MTDPRVAVDALAADPMYQLSTAGQELFHTNMLYWLAVHRPAESGVIWDLLGVDAPIGGVDSRGEIRREWQHIDLYVDSGMPGRKLVLENKVLAIATPNQLVAYRKKLRSLREFAGLDPQDDKTAWRLLTLLPVNFVVPGPWEVITYRELLPALQASADALEGRERALLAGYTDLVRGLVDVAEGFDIASRLDEHLGLDAGLIEVLREARMLSLVRKLQVARCSALIAEALLGMPGLDGVSVGARLTNTEGLIELFVSAPKGRQFGWQIQGSQVRLVMLTGGRDKKTIAGRNEAAVGQEKYFTFDLPDHLAALTTPYRGRKEWLGFGPEFVHRYETLKPDVTWRQLIDLTVHLSVRAHAWSTTATS